MPKYLINSQETWEVEADSEEEAFDKFGQRHELRDIEGVTFRDQDVMLVSVEGDDGE